MIDQGTARINALLLEREQHRKALKEMIKRGEWDGIATRDEPLFTMWVGTREELISEVGCVPAQFPVGRLQYSDDRRSGVEIESCAGGGVRFWRLTRFGGDFFEYIVWWDDNTRQRMNTRQPEERGPEYSSPEAYAEHADDVIDWGLQMLRRVITGTAEQETFGSITLAYDKDTVKRVTDALDGIWQTVQSGSVYSTKDTVTKRKQTAAAHADADFQRFMADLNRPGRS